VNANEVGARNRHLARPRLQAWGRSYQNLQVLVVITSICKLHILHICNFLTKLPKFTKFFW
jgi:hypothetical protein